jgi:hypothetical protein
MKCLRLTSSGAEGAANRRACTSGPHGGGEARQAQDACTVRHLEDDRASARLVMIELILASERLGGRGGLRSHLHGRSHEGRGLVDSDGEE